MNAKQINWPRSRQMLLAAGLVASCLASAAELGSPVAFNAVSPDGKNELRLEVDGNGMEYSVWRSGKSIVEPTPISLEIDGLWDLHDNGAQPKIVKLVKFGKTTEVSRGAVLNGVRCTPKVTTRKVDGTLATPLYKKSSVDLAANETRVDFGDWAVRLHARNDGVAWRFETEFEGEITVNAESTNIRFPKETELCYTVAGGLMSGWERPARIGSVESVPAGHPQIVMTPFTATVPGAGLVTVTESDLRDYPGLNFYRRGNEPDTLRSWQAGVPKELDKGRRRIKVASREPYLAKTKGTRTFPWRVFVLGDTPSALVASDAVYALAAPNSSNPNSPTPDFSWVKPGQVAWDWWNGRRITDVPGLVSGCNYETYKAYIDFAAANGIAYVILDEGWAEKLNLEHPRDEVDVPGVIAYGKAKGVGVILWAACPSLFDPGTRRRVFDRYAAMGAKGFKIDFIERDDQEAERFLEEAAADAAERHLVVLYHGIHKPTGLQRMYPNILNYEGVYGLEQGGSIGGRKVVVSNDVNLVYTRMVAGFMDYTPGAMRNRAFDAPPFDAEKDIRACYGTRCHQLALFPLFEAPIQMLCDSPTQYRTAPECTSFITKVPTVWDETVGIAGEIGKYAVVARRKGGEWWLGAITNWEARELELATDFLGEGEWKVEAFEDAPDADVNAEHYVRRVFTVKAGEPLKVRLASGGGFAARLVPAVAAANAAEVKVYPQSFEAGGWGLDAQFMDVMGSPYLIAHGLGVRVLDAKARVDLPEAGEYRVWVRTKNWADGAPGRFRVLVNGKALGKEFGAGPREWAWEDGGVVTVEKGETTVALSDLTGFDGRCAGIVFASGGEKPEGPLKVDEANVAETVKADFVVVGGGMPGTCAAVAAARRGLKVALVQDRPVLGGNASGEIRVYCAGEAKHPLVRELRNYFMNRDVNMPWCDERRMRIVEDEKNIELRLLTRAFGVEKNVDGTIAAVKALDLKSNRVVRFEAPLFCDATGDGWVGYWAGADWRMGREAQSEFGESRAPETADGDTLGASIMWTSADANMAVPFSAPFAEPHAQGIVAVNGEWRWEYGIHRDMIAEGEEIRDRMLLAIYGAFSLAKKRPENANKVLNFCPYLIGKRESRRIMGDWVLSQNDVATNKEFEDSIATGTWGIDLHYDGYKPGVDFLSRNTFDQHGRFWIPYRSIYSRNIGNLFVVGRCFSCTHVGLGAPRVISTLSQLGVAAGEAAAMCRELDETPRGIWKGGHVRKLQERLGGGFPGVPDAKTAGWLIVDDDSEGVKIGKGWKRFTNTNGGYVGMCAYSPGKNAEPVIYPLPVREAGRYTLMGRVPYAYSAKPGSATAFEIVSGGKTTAFTADQAQSTGEWVKLGEFDLEPGATLTIIPAKSRGHVVADGFALVPATFAYSSSVALAKADCADLSSGAFAKSEAATALKVEDLKRLKRELAVPCETNGWGQLFVRCQVNGAECRLLVDTCCSCTFFDMPFVERAFGRDAVRSVNDPRAATSNIDSIRKSGAALKLHGVSVSISGVEFGGLDVTVIDGDWDESDGMLGLDVLGSVPTLVSVGDRKLVFNLRERKGFKSYTSGGFVPGGEDICSFFGIVNGKPVSFLLDTGCNMTQLMGGQGWQWKPGMKGESQEDNINGSRKVEMAWGMPASVTACDVDISLKSPLVKFGDPKHQRINDIGVDTLKDYDILVWDRYFYSVRPRDAKLREDVSPVFLDLDFDTTAAPDLKKWTRSVLGGARYMRNAVSAVAIYITSGWPVPRRVKVAYVDDDGAPPVRIADGTSADVYLNAKWFRENRDGDAAGAFFRALVQVMQGYGKTPGATEENCPKWLAEGIAEYAKCYIFDQYSGKRDYSCDNVGACRYNDSCRATASFLNVLVRKYPGILARANAALRAHAFDDGTFWKDATGMTADELEKLWRVELAGGVATAAPAPMERKETE